MSIDLQIAPPAADLKAAADILIGAPFADRATVLDQPCPVPSAAGVYAWFFAETPETVPVHNCFRRDGKVLLYAGIAPRAPPMNGAPRSRQTLRSRIRYHFRGNAAGSTLRLTLGVLLAGELGIQLRRVGSGIRRTFTREGEARLSQWMAQNAFVCWLAHPEPWLIEAFMMRRHSLPLNLQGNRGHAFHDVLKRLRSEARASGDRQPIVAG